MLAIIKNGIFRTSYSSSRLDIHIYKGCPREAIPEKFRLIRALCGTTLMNHLNIKSFIIWFQSLNYQKFLTIIKLKITVFVPDDGLLLEKFPRNVFINMEKHQARRMIEYNTLPRLINMKELLSSGSMKLNTRIRGQVIYTQVKGSHENPTLFLNMTSRVVRPNLIVGNALIHVTDSFVVPEM